MTSDALSRAPSNKWMCFLAISLGTFIAYVDVNIVNIALPTMASDFQVDITDVKWVVTSYLLVITSLVVIFGRVADLYGRKRLYVFGFIVFTIGSALCVIAPTIWALALFRALKAIGGAALMANGSAILTETFPAAERGKALGSLGSVIAVAALAGPLFGGFISEHLGWRAIFLVTVPVGIVGTVLALRVLPQTQRSGKSERFDFAGAVTLVACLSCFLFLTSVLGKPERTSGIAAALFIAMTSLAIIFVKIETRIAHPLLEPELFRHRAFNAAIASSFLSFWALSALSFLMPFYLDRVLGMSPSRIGLLIIPVPIVLFVVAPIGGRLADRFGSRAVCTAGAVVNCVGMIFLSTLGTETTALGIVLRMIPFGVGTGLFQPPNNSAIMGAVPKSRLGIASGMISGIKNLGSMSGVAITTLLFSIVQVFALNRYSQPGVTSGEAASQSFAFAVSVMFLISAAICAVVIVTSLIRDPVDPRRGASSAVGTGVGEPLKGS